MTTPKAHLVVIGGGTGTATVLAALGSDPHLDLTAIVAVSDSGGSSGRLRDEFGFIPVGDIRQCLAALATGKNSRYVQQLLLYRFGEDTSFAHHNLGNLILTALTDLYQTPGKAIEVASKILRINGRVYPISEQPADLVITYQNGQQVIGEDYLNYPANGGQKIARISLSHPTQIYDQAKTAIETADLIIFGPGDLYASLLPHTQVEGFKTALATSPAKFVYIANLMTSRSQTYQMTAQDHLREVIKYTGRQPDVVIVNNQTIDDPTVIKNYQAEGYAPLLDDLSAWESRLQVLRAPLVAPVLAAKAKNDLLPRNFLRHHADNLHALIRKLLDE